MSISEKKIGELELTEQTPETEKLLLARLKSSTSSEEHFRWLLFVVGFYRSINKIQAAAGLLEKFIQSNSDAEQSAHCYLALGQIATDEQRHEAALDYFSEALKLAPKRRKVLYVLHNNIGYCLNSLGQFRDGEEHCRMAIDIDSTRASGYRNLGVSFNGQNNVVSSAWALVEAMKADEADNRARVLLDELLGQNPALAVQCPWVFQVNDPELGQTADLPPVI